jgi:uncharacterized membrane protein YdjX (TVP38/TMEM64 family)
LAVADEQASANTGAVSVQESSQARVSFPWRWAAYATLLIALIIAGKTLPWQSWLREVLDGLAALGAWGPVIFIGVYIIGAVFLVPGSALTLGAGAVFGVFRGTLIVSVASTLAATAAFLIGRYLAREAVARRMQGQPRFSAIDRAVAQEGWKIVLLTRLSPIFPYTLLNYAFGLTQVKVGHYVLASWMGMLPGTVMYVYLGSLAQVVGQRERTMGEWILYATGLLATLGVTLFITRIARRALAKAAPADPTSRDPAKPAIP